MAFNASVLPKKKPIAEKPAIKVLSDESGLCSSVIGVYDPSTKASHNYVFDKQMYDMRCDTLLQVRFWRNIMNLNEDSCIINVATHRHELMRMESKKWSTLSDGQKTCFKDSVRMALNLDSSHRILLTTGKKFFYDFDRAYLQFEKGINCFIENDVDPWYAQSILLIESPNKLQKSNAGAYGPFQLMKNVARLFGLTVNRHVDERANFERAAFAASSLIKKVCIPKTREMLDSLGITNYSETDLWFRLLVMHSYHAGAGNVKLALRTFNPSVGDMNLIYNLWKAETRHFRSASQNYSQLVLAAHLEMNDRKKDHIEFLSKSNLNTAGSTSGSIGKN